MLARPRTDQHGFTLIELLVVVAIIGLISAIALPTVLTGLNERRVSESARLLQAILAGTRDAAIRANAPRGIRLLPDPVFNGSSGMLASNRVIPIEPGPDYTEGLVSGVVVPSNNTPAYYASIYNTYNNSTNTKTTATYLILAESDFSGTVPNNPTSWSFNVRQGDKIRFNDSGPYYTIAGPINGAPFGANTPNSERVISCPISSPSVPLAGQTGWKPEYLFLMNGQDDNGNGWIDEGCDGIDNDGDGIVDPGFNGVDDNGDHVIDDPAELLIGKVLGAEYEVEVFIGSQANTPPLNQAYTIYRRPVVSPGARETTLPSGVVIDLTTWNASFYGFLPERSRVPVDAYTYYVDIMIDQNGHVITPGAGSDGGSFYANSPLSSLPFYHFWLTEREGVVAPAAVTKTTVAPLLPMPQGTPFYTPPVGVVPPYLTGERRLVTLFVKTGQIVTNSISNSVPNPNDPPHPLGSFSGNDTNYPFYGAQAGIKEPL